MNMQYNGLKNDINNLGKFVFIYETKIKKMGKEDDFSQWNYEAFYLFKKKIQVNVKFATISEIKNLPKQSKQTLYFTKRRNQILDFCRHLRISFSHGLLENRDKKMIILDKYRGNYTSEGFIEYDIAKEFIVNIIKGFETIEYHKKD